jgi:hypothetical protein
VLFTALLKLRTADVINEKRNLLLIIKMILEQKYAARCNENREQIRPTILFNLTLNYKQ